MNETYITDDNFHEFAGDVVVDGQNQKRGLIPRDYDKDPVGSYRGVGPYIDPTIPREEWSQRIKDKIAAKSQLSDVRNQGDNGKRIPSLDQNGKGYCWSHSVTMALILIRAVMGQKYVRLSAYAVACVIKKFRDEGGWGALALDFIINRGVPSVQKWPEKSMSRNNDNADTWKDAENYKVTEGWVDINTQVYDRNLTFDQVATCLLMNIPVVLDLNWWGHSVCGMDLVEVNANLPLSDPNRWGIRIINSWSDNWENAGTAVLVGRKAIPDGAVAPAVALAA